MSTSTKPTREKQSTPFQYPRAQRLRNHYEDTTQEKRQETLRHGTEPHRNAITLDTTQEKRQETLRRGRERKQQEGNRTRRRENSKKLCVAARNHTETQSPRSRRRKNGTELCVADGRREDKCRLRTFLKGRNLNPLSTHVSHN